LRIPVLSSLTSDFASCAFSRNSKATTFEFLALSVRSLPKGTMILGGSRMHTFQTEIPDVSKERLRDLVQTLEDMRLLDAGMFEGLVSGRAAIDVRPTVTDFGARFLRFLSVDADQG